MSKLGVFLSRQELRVVFDGFDTNKDGNIQWAEFIEGLKVRLLPFILLSQLLSLRDYYCFTRAIIIPALNPSLLEQHN